MSFDNQARSYVLSARTPGTTASHERSLPLTCSPLPPLLAERTVPSIEDLACDPGAGVQYRGFGEPLHLFEMDASAHALAAQLKEMEQVGE
jgi:hypothetical protein